VSHFFLKLLRSQDIRKNLHLEPHDFIFEGLFQINGEYLKNKQAKQKNETRFYRSKGAEKSYIKMVVFPISPCTFSLCKIGTFLLKIASEENNF